MSLDVRHDSDAHRFVHDTPVGPAHLDYTPIDGGLRFLHTSVPEGHRGDGIGTALVEAGLAYARDHDLAVDPQCPFVAAYMEGHPATQDLRAEP